MLLIQNSINLVVLLIIRSSKVDSTNRIVRTAENSITLQSTVENREKTI